MGGNEILLNLENSEHLWTSEIISGLLELSKRDKKKEHDWEVHPWVRGAFAQLENRVGQFPPKHLIMTAMAMDRLQYEDTNLYHKISDHILRMLHLFNGKMLFLVLRTFAPLILERGFEDNIDVDYNEG